MPEFKPVYCGEPYHVHPDVPGPDFVCGQFNGTVCDRCYVLNHVHEALLNAEDNWDDDYPNRQRIRALLGWVMHEQNFEFHRELLRKVHNASE